MKIYFIPTAVCTLNKEKYTILAQAADVFITAFFMAFYALWAQMWFSCF